MEILGMYDDCTVKVQYMNGGEDYYEDNVIIYNLHEKMDGYVNIIEEYSVMEKGLSKELFLEDHFSVSVGTDRYYPAEAMNKLKNEIAWYLYKLITKGKLKCQNNQN